MFLNLLDYEEKTVFKQLAVLVARADGDFSDREKEKIGEFCKEMGIECGDLKEDMNLDEIAGFFSKKEAFKKKAVVFEILCLMLVDGLVREEKKILKFLLERLGIDKSFEEKVLKWCQEYNRLKFEAFLLIGEGV